MKPSTSETVTFHTALLAAQSEMQNPEMDSTNPHFRNKYASLGAFLRAVLPPLNKHGIRFAQDLLTTDSGVSCTTILTYITGEEIRYGPFTVPAARMDAHGIGSAASYSKRYTIGSVFGLVSSESEDDDGNEATGNRNAAPAVQAKPLLKKQVIDESAAQRLSEKITADGIEPGAVQRFLALKKAWPQGCQRIEDLPAKIADRIMNPEVWTTVLSFIQTEGSPDGQK